MAWARAAALVLALAGAGPAAGEGIVAAEYADPTDRYDHDILGDTPDYGTLVLRTETGRGLRILLPETRVFEDTAPRLADIDGDGGSEAIVVETDLSAGARLAIYGAGGLIAATGFIGRTHRWLAPVGAVDLDGDGRVEIGYVDRPHLAKVLRVVRLEGGALREIARMEGLTNHRIGDPVIRSGVRRCAGGPAEFVLQSADRSRIVAVTLAGGALRARAAGVSLERALACRD